MVHKVKQRNRTVSITSSSLNNKTSMKTKQKVEGPKLNIDLSDRNVLLEIKKQKKITEYFQSIEKRGFSKLCTESDPKQNKKLGKTNFFLYLKPIKQQNFTINFSSDHNILKKILKIFHTL